MYVDGNVMAIRGESNTTTEEFDPIPLPDIRGLYFVPISFVTILGQYDLSPAASITTWFRLDDTKTLSTYTFFARTSTTST